MTSDEMNFIVDMMESLGLKLATAFPEGDDLFFVDYVDPKDRHQVTHIRRLYELMPTKHVMFGIGTAQSDHPKMLRLVFTKQKGS